MDTNKHTEAPEQASDNDVIDSTQASITTALVWKDIEDRGGLQTSEEVVSNYAKTANRYEEGLRLLGYPAPKMIGETVEMLLKDNFDTKILDLGAGTGLVAAELTIRGYTNLDAVDASDAMLKIAAEKKLYKKTVCHFVGDTPIPLEDNSYDMVVTCGAFGCNFMPISGLDEAIRVVRAGGYIVNATRILQRDWLSTFDAHMQKLEEQKKWRQVSKTMIPGFVGEHDGCLYVHTVL